MALRMLGPANTHLMWAGRWNWVFEVLQSPADSLCWSLRHASVLLLPLNQLVWACELGTRLASPTLYTLVRQWTYPPSFWHFCEGWMNGLHQVCPVPYDHLISIIYACCLFALWSVPVITAGQSESRRAGQPREQSCCYLSSMHQAHFNLNLEEIEKKRQHEVARGYKDKFFFTFLSIEFCALSKSLRITNFYKDMHNCFGLIPDYKCDFLKTHFHSTQLIQSQTCYLLLGYL